MNFLIEMNFSEEVINRIELANDKSLIFNFICSATNVKKNIEYFRSIGIDVIELLLIYRLELFLIDNKEIEKAVESFDVPTLVQLINEDINAVNLL